MRFSKIRAEHEVLAHQVAEKDKYELTSDHTDYEELPSWLKDLSVDPDTPESVQVGGGWWDRGKLWIRLETEQGVPLPTVEGINPGQWVTLDHKGKWNVLECEVFAATFR